MTETQTDKYKNVQIEILLEELSMENFLKEILPQVLPKGYELDVNCFLRPHNGKSDLKASIPKKIRAFSNFHIPTKILIIQDQDSNDCKKLKSNLITVCESATNNPKNHCPIMIRIACRELENWYLGDMQAIEKVYPRFKARNHKYKSKFRDTDNCQGAYELEKLIPTFQKGFASKNISKHMNVESNNSESFNQLISGVKNFLQ